MYLLRFWDSDVPFQFHIAPAFRTHLGMSSTQGFKLLTCTPWFIQRFGKKHKIGIQFWVTGMYNPDYGISFWTMTVGYKCIPPITWDESGGYDLIITNYPGIYIYIYRLSPLYLHDIPMNHLKIIMISHETYLKIPKYIYYIHYYGISTIGILEIMDSVIPKNDYPLVI